MKESLRINRYLTVYKPGLDPDTSGLDGTSFRKASAIRESRGERQDHRKGLATARDPTLRRQLAESYLVALPPSSS